MNMHRYALCFTDGEARGGGGEGLYQSVVELSEPVMLLWFLYCAFTFE